MKKTITILAIGWFAIAGTQTAQAQEEITDQEISCFYIAAQYITNINNNIYAYMDAEARELETPSQRVYDIFIAEKEGTPLKDVTEQEQKDYLSVKDYFQKLETEREKTISEYFEDSWMMECLSESRFNYILDKANNDPSLVERMQEVLKEDE